MGPPKNRHIHFTVTHRTPTHLTNIKKHYDSKKANCGPEQPLEFSENNITLDIPKGGCDIDEWKIIPMTPAKIFKRDVDKHLPETNAFPHCELMAKWMKSDQQLKSLLHIVNVQGTTKETFFTINIDPDPPDPDTDHRHHGLSTVKADYLNIDDLGEVLDEVESLSSRWRRLFTNLHLRDTDLDEIECNNPGNVGGCLHNALRVWLKWNFDIERYGKPSWRKLAEAVRNLDSSLSRRIARAHPHLD